MHCKITAKLSNDLTNTKDAQPYQLGDINTRQVSWYVAFLIPLITVHYFVIFRVILQIIGRALVG